MTPTTCTHCSSPLPAVAADQRRPDWCPACVARAAGPNGATGEVPPLGTVPPPATWGSGFPGVAAPPNVPAPLGARPVMITRTRALEGLVVGVAAAALAGALWWAIVALTERQFVYGAIGIGVLVGQGVLIGARKGGLGPAVVAALASLAALAVAEYFIQRSLAISNLQADVPLWLGFSTAREVVQEGVKAEPLTGVFWAIAAVVAAVSAGSPTRRPVL